MEDMPTRPRNLMEGWCREGITLAKAADSVSPAAHREREAEFGQSEADEARAAAYLHIFTGDLPRLEDKNGRQRAVDLTLHNANQLTGIAEVTSTLDGNFQRNSAQLRRLVEDINLRYNGSDFWALGFEHGWTMPPNRDLSALSEHLCAQLISASETPGIDIDAPVKLAENVVGYRVAAQSPEQVRLSSWNANIPGSSEDPYLDRLSTYLSSSDLITKKVEKLYAEKVRLCSNKQHLYLLMASTGDSGDLLPTSPSFFTWGSFSCPEPITDLWLDGGTGEIYHWNMYDGWVFHRVNG